MAKVKSTLWKKQESYIVPEELEKYYFRDSTTTWISIPESKWFYKETTHAAIFADRGPWLTSAKKRLPPRRLITISADAILLHLLPTKHYNLLAMLEEYAEDLQTNFRELGRFDVENTPHIFD